MGTHLNGCTVTLDCSHCHVPSEPERRLVMTVENTLHVSCSTVDFTLDHSPSLRLFDPKCSKSSQIFVLFKIAAFCLNIL